MQFSSLLTAAAAATVVSASKLPSTITIFAIQNGVQVGCINGYGNFTRNLQWCLPFRVFYTDDVNGTLQGYQKCTVGAGTLDCNQQSPASLGSFQQSDVYLAIVSGSLLNTAFSIDSFPTADDNVGVPTKVGNSGTYGQLLLKVKSTQG